MYALGTGQTATNKKTAINKSATATTSTEHRVTSRAIDSPIKLNTSRVVR